MTSMKLRQLTILGSLLAAPAVAQAGGLFVPGSGAISSSRAGAAVASVDDGESLGINPAGFAKTNGTTITVSAVVLQYSMKFSRAGTYDPIENDLDAESYVGAPYETVENKPDPPFGFGAFQPIPVIVVATDLGGRVPKLRMAAGLFAPNAYPFRDMSNGYIFNSSSFKTPPPATRYDIIKQEGVLLLPSIAAAYRITPQLDVGVRLTWGIAQLKSTVALWGSPDNFEENAKEDDQIAADVSDSFVPAAGIGVTYRPTPEIELGASWSSMAPIHARGSAVSELGPVAARPDERTEVSIQPSSAPRCAPEGGGTVDALNTCVALQLPMSATIGGRYKLLDAGGGLRGDVELNIGWENWGKRCNFKSDPGCTSPGQYFVVIDAEPLLNGNPGPVFKDEIAEHRLKDTFSFRLGGSYHVPLGSAAGADRIILRGGAAYDTRAAEDGWLRADVDGAARVTTTIGGAYRTRRYEINLGAGYVYEGKNTNSGSCNPTATAQGCIGNGSENPIEERRGPDPINPLVVPNQQAESPINQGSIKSSYLMFMVGATTWF
jgi:long-subunit fatty acid transport protein